ncbi:hypothetical protein P3X46_030308 [Hevea brasiliensis]|uniref:Terpene synthase n=1 Tax=Hevea brasiliensis TaxID=3981 RepID=A0ABQ9KGS5_HEVBR|nr:hypothetical protein P3X46_030308 [Hevea brasiliensis]
MAFTQSASFRFCTILPLKTRTSLPLSSTKCLPSYVHAQHTIATKIPDNITVRRSANYPPSKWSHDFVASLKNEYAGEPYTTRVNKLKEEVKTMLESATNPLDQLEIIDALQRLGVAYHFEDQIETKLKSIYNDTFNKQRLKQDPHSFATALEFRLLRKHGYNVPQGEAILEEAQKFSSKNLKAYLKKENNSSTSGDDAKNDHLNMARHALELPFHWRMQRLEARWFIDVYENSPDMKPILLEHAKLDFNMVQAVHQQDLKHASSWWKGTGLGEKLAFVRARPMEGFLWTVGGVFEPQYGHFRRILSQVGALITVIDDIYDVYSTLDEVELFTEAVTRWDINEMDKLADYMKICFLALYNSINEIAFDSLKEEELHITPYLKKAWADLCKSYLLEAKWYHSGYTPSVEEYSDNAWVSISAPLLLVHAYFAVPNHITKEASECILDYPNIVKWSSLITRLADDLGTSKRGDNPKSIECYMHESGASEAAAREHIHYLISEAWKKINEYQIGNTAVFSQTFIRMAMNLARMSQCIYQHGDGFGAQNLETKNRVISLLVEPVSLASKD